MSAVVIKVAVEGVDREAATLRGLVQALSSRGPLHKRMATAAGDFTREYLIGTPRNNTAKRLGAAPTGFRAKNARALQESSDEVAATLAFPRSTGLSRAFHDVVIVPGTGRTYLTIPDHARTYGKVVRDFPEDAFEFAVVKTATMAGPALVFTGTEEVGFWLRRRVKQKQDRTLLPTTESYQEIGRRVSVAYIAHLVYNEPEEGRA